MSSAAAEPTVADVIGAAPVEALRQQRQALAREIAQYLQMYTAEAQASRPSRALLYSYASRLLKLTALAYLEIRDNEPPKVALPDSATRSTL